MYQVKAAGREGLSRGKRAMRALLESSSDATAPTTPEPQASPALEALVDMTWADVEWSDGEFVERAYRRILGRSPDPVGLEDRLGELSAGGSRSELVAELASSDEAAKLPEWWQAEHEDDPRAFLHTLYKNVLWRDPDPVGLRTFLARMEGGDCRLELYQEFLNSDERAGGPTPHKAFLAFHASRETWIRSLPRAKRILDLGGTALGDPRGAMIFMGYPYEFDRLVIIELPGDARHDLYKVSEHESVETIQGPVHYLYRSMCDLDDIADGSFDMVVSAQTIEHISQEEGAKLVKDVARVLAPGGYFAVDTPNGAVSGIQARELGTDFINPDHKVEYTHDELRLLLEDAGLVIERAFGIGYMPKTATTGKWDLEEQIQYQGLYVAIEHSYTQAYLARKPMG